LKGFVGNAPLVADFFKPKRGPGTVARFAKENFGVGRVNDVNSPDRNKDKERIQPMPRNLKDCMKIRVRQQFRSAINHWGI
jgi:hypothetical protein